MECAERCRFHRLRNFLFHVGDLVVCLAGDPECTEDVALR